MENGSPPKRRRLIKSPQRPSPLRRPLHCIAEQRSRATRSSNAKTDEKSKPKPPPSSKAPSTKSKGAKPTKTKSPPHPEPETPSSSKAEAEITHQNSSNQNETACSQNVPAESPQAPETTSQAPPSAKSKNTKTPVPEVGHMCEEHVSCRPVTWKTMSEKLKKVCRVISGLASTVQKYDNVQGFNWVEGEYLLHALLKHPESWEEECSICAGLEFMYRDWDFFYLCLEGVRISWGIDGNESVEEVQDWMEGLLAYQA